MKVPPSNVSRTLFGTSLAVLVLTGFAADQPASPDSDAAQLRFRVVSPEENGTRALLDQRHAAVLERQGGKIGSHDWWLWGLTAIDHDRDGDPDLVVTIHGSNHGIFLQNQFKETGKLTFTDITRELDVDWKLPSAVGRKTFAWDFDGDGWLDLIGVRSPHFLNQQGRKFVAIGRDDFESFSPQDIVDLNGDGHPDIYHIRGENFLYDPKGRGFLKQPYQPAMQERLPAEVNDFLSSLKSRSNNRFMKVRHWPDVDLNGDGLADLIVDGYASYGGDAFGRYLIADRDGRLSDQTERMGLPKNGTPMLIRDLNGDGAIDLLIAAHSDGGLFLNDGRGKFTRKPGELTDQLRSREPYLHRADVVDFDGDGDLDLVVSKPRIGPRVIYENRGQGDFRSVQRQRGWDSDPVAICDLNCDGLPDVAIGGPDNGVTFYINESDAGNKRCNLHVRMPAPNVNGVGAVVQLYAAGSLGKEGAKPLRTDKAPIDGTPIYLGLGKEARFDLRVAFPDGKVVELKDVELKPSMQITPDGILKDIS